MKPPVQSMESLLTRMGRQIDRLDRRPHNPTTVLSTTVAAVQNREALPHNAAPGAGFLIIDDDTLVVRTATGWSEFDPEGAAWTLPSYLRSGGVV